MRVLTLNLENLSLFGPSIETFSNNVILLMVLYKSLIISGIGASSHSINQNSTLFEFNFEIFPAKNVIIKSTKAKLVLLWCFKTFRNESY